MSSHAFEAEVHQVLRLVVNSLYSNKEVFLRELVSNASDALDKLRFRSLTEPEVMAGDGSLGIRIAPDADAKLLRIEDSGCGMTEEELKANLGTIARSGTRELVERLAKEGKDSLPLIGQFGVGFYSAYLVADRVEVVTRAAGPDAKAWRWSSDGKSTYTIEPADRERRGTEIVLHLRDDSTEYLDAWRLRELIGRYSDYVSFPITLATKDKDGKVEEKQANRGSALWQRPKSEVTNEQYVELYKHVSHDFEEPRAWTHFRVEGRVEFVGLLYVPKRAPFDLYDATAKQKRGVRLFVKRVLILDDCDELLPTWLRFVRGVVESDDLPLNVSRELLQDSSVLAEIKKHSTKKVLDLLGELAQDKPEEYADFWKTFGRVVKEGAALGGAEHHERLARLFRYASTADAEKETSLEDYKKRMPEGQEAIYYLYGPSRAVLEGSPYIETLHKKGYEVLFMTDPVDEWVCESLREFDGKPLVNAMRADLKLNESDASKKEKEEKTQSLAPLLDQIKKVLGDKIREVKVSDRLTDSPACLALEQGAAPAYLENLMRSSGRAMPGAKRIFEVNPTHSIIVALSKKAEAGSQGEDLAEWINVLYEQARIAEGSAIEDPNGFLKRVTKLLTSVVGA
jgi:molecular chaperone HtpG